MPRGKKKTEEPVVQAEETSEEATPEVVEEPEEAETEPVPEPAPKKGEPKPNVAVVYEGRKEVRRYTEKHGDFESLANQYVEGRPDRKLRVETKYEAPGVKCPRCGYEVRV